MKKWFTFILIFMGITCLSACTSGISRVEGNSDPEPISEGQLSGSFFTDIEMETSYDNIIAYTEEASYPVDTEQIFCMVQNNNIAKAFYLYEIPLVEKKVGGNWVRLYYDSDRLNVAQWCVCAEEGKIDEPFSTGYTVVLDDIIPKVTPGEYRLVVFTAKKTLYAPFTLTER